MTILRARLAFAAVAACACAALAQETPASVYAVKDGAITYIVVHKLHQVRGTSRKLEGLAKIQAAGPTLVQVRAPLASFDSGNSNRDAHMREVTHESIHSYA
jgi:polyisoprenoid-binding protein YceI